MSHILIVDDEESICWGLRKLLRAKGHSVAVSASVEDALVLIDEGIPDAIVLDVRLPGVDGLTALPWLRERCGSVPIVVITAFGNLETAVQAIHGGAFDYLPKPFDLDQAANVIGRALESPRASPAVDEMCFEEDEILGATPAVQEVFKRIALVAPSDVSVLIQGESGTGKELIARAIHRHSLRRTAPLIPVNLAALSPTVIESELFGHVRGAFTGAEADRAGILELANGGTVLLDEAGDIPPHIQTKLLRALERKEVMPVGEAATRLADFRLIAATNRDLRQEMLAGRFREDLYYRLSVFTITLPPLRERASDIPLLARWFLDRFEARHTTGTPRGSYFLPSTLDELSRRPWPGNVRELRNAVEHAALVARGGPIAVEHLPPASRWQANGPVDLKEQLADILRRWAEWRIAQTPSRVGLYQEFLNATEPTLFSATLKHTDLNQSAAADMLGIHRALCAKKLNEHAHERKSR